MDPNQLSENNTVSPSPASDGLASLPPLPEAEDDTFLPPPPPPEVTPMVPTPPAGVPLAEEKPEPKKKLIGKIIGGVIAVLLLVGVPLVAMNIDKFRGDTRSSAAPPADCTGCADKNHEWKMVNGECKKRYLKDCDGGGGGGACGGPLSSPGCVDKSPGDYCLDNAICETTTADNCACVPLTPPPTPTTGDGCTPDQQSVCERRGEICGSSGICRPAPAPTGGTYDDCIVLGADCETENGMGKCRATGAPDGGLYCQVTITPAPTGGTGGSCTVGQCSDFYGQPTATCCSGFACTGVDPQLGFGYCLPTGGGSSSTSSGGSSSSTSSGGGGGGSCSSASAARCQGQDPGDACGNDNFVCKALTNQIGPDGKVKCSCDGGGGGDVGACMETRIYTLQDGNWVITPASQVGQFAGVGEMIRLAVRGNNSGFSNGRFRVNGGSWVTTNTKNSAGEFYIEYTLSQTGSYAVEGQVQ